MQLRFMLSWLGLRVLIPFSPVAIDFALRFLLLWDKSEWWEMVDVKTVSIAGAFFCLLIAIEATIDNRIPSDDKYENGLRTFKTHMMIAGVLLAVIFGFSTLAEYSDVKSSKLTLTPIIIPFSLATSLLITIFAIISAIFADMRYQFKF